MHARLLTWPPSRRTLEPLSSRKPERTGTLLTSTLVPGGVWTLHTYDGYCHGTTKLTCNNPCGTIILKKMKKINKNKSRRRRRRQWVDHGMLPRIRVRMFGLIIKYQCAACTHLRLSRVCCPRPCLKLLYSMAFHFEWPSVSRKSSSRLPLWKR